MAPGFLVHQRKRFRRSRSLIVFGPVNRPAPHARPTACRLAITPKSRTLASLLSCGWVVGSLSTYR